MSATGRLRPQRVKTALVVVAGLAAVIPMPAGWVERAYSESAYRVLQHPLTTASNAVPFALFDALVAGVTTAWIVALVRDVRGAGVWVGIRATLLRTLWWAAVAYLVFLAFWGLNYRRLPLQARLPFDRTRITREHARRVALVAVDRLNALAADAHRIGWLPVAEIDPALRDGLSRALGSLALDTPTVARPKHTLFDLYFRRAGVEGMTNPFLLETLVVSDLLPFERPFVIAHEWSHLAGLADESAASFAGWLACVRGSVPNQYSGWLFLYEEFAAALPRDDRTAVFAALGGTPRADLAASRARVAANVQPNVSAAAWRAYDSYLKSNRVAAGTRSYDEVVQLVLGTEFDEQWRPSRR